MGQPRRWGDVVLADIDVEGILTPKDAKAAAWRKWSLQHASLQQVRRVQQQDLQQAVQRAQEEA